MPSKTLPKLLKKGSPTYYTLLQVEVSLRLTWHYRWHRNAWIGNINWILTLVRTEIGKIIDLPGNKIQRHFVCLRIQWSNFDEVDLLTFQSLKHKYMLRNGVEKMYFNPSPNLLVLRQIWEPILTVIKYESEQILNPIHLILREMKELKKYIKNDLLKS